MNKSRIRWTEMTWNPLRGCSVVSPGCTNCYAMSLSARFSGHEGSPFAGYAEYKNGHPVWTGKVSLMEHKLHEPFSWQKRAAKTGERILVFTNSMSDIFHEKLPFEDIQRIFEVMHQCPNLTFQVLTKRHERMREFLNWYWGKDLLKAPSYPRNIWIGVSVEDQVRADERIPVLVSTPAVIRFLSVEPQLGPVSLERYLWAHDSDGRRKGGPYGHIHWVISGAESGRRRRPFTTDWAKLLRDQCHEAQVAFFFKQHGNLKPEYEPYIDGFKYAQYPDMELDKQLPQFYGSCEGEKIDPSTIHGELVVV